MLSWLYMVKVPSQTVLALLRYRYLRKSCRNPLCPRGNLYGTIIMRDFDQIQITFLMVHGNCL